jgi:hypothetical protein
VRYAQTICAVSALLVATCPAMLVAASPSFGQPLPNFCPPGHGQVPDYTGYRCVPQTDVPKYFGPQPDLTAPQYNPIIQPDPKQNIFRRAAQQLAVKIGMLWDSNPTKRLYGTGPLSQTVNNPINAPKPPSGFIDNGPVASPSSGGSTNRSLFFDKSSITDPAPSPTKRAPSAPGSYAACAGASTGFGSPTPSYCEMGDYYYLRSGRVISKDNLSP